MYDLGCGDASLLVYAVGKGNLARAVGFENMSGRARRARMRIREAGLEGKIIIEDDMYAADLSKADVIFDMMPEGRRDLASLYGRNRGIRKGTRLIKHDLPLVGFLPERVRLPFYDSGNLSGDDYGSPSNNKQNFSQVNNVDIGKTDNRLRGVRT